MILSLANNKMFIINEVKKKTRTGGKGLCRVFLIDDSCGNWIADITERIAEMSVWKECYDWVNLTINYGSWTGAMRIAEIIRLNRGNDSQIIDVSIF